MGVRNCAEIGENLQTIMTRLMANDNLVNLLYYTDKDVEQVKYLVPDARDAAIIDAFYFNQIDGVEYEEADVYGVRAKGYLIFIPGYDEPQFITEAEYNKILNDLAVTKYNKVFTSN